MEIDKGTSKEQSFVRDQFCWLCREKETNLNCSMCFRTFHEECLTTRSNSCMEHEKDTLICPICTVLETSKATHMENRQVLNLLKHTMERVLAVSNFKVFQDLTEWKSVQSYNDHIVNPIDLNEIGRKVIHKLYDSFMAFIIDIASLLHNCHVHFRDHNRFIGIAENLFNFCTIETECISSCANCYENKMIMPGHWRTIACSKPHLILWAELSRCLDWPIEKGFTHWPAKLLSVVDEQIKVIFFGHTKFMNISAENCYIFSTKPLDSLNSKADHSLVEGALKEVEMYLKNVEAKFGCIQRTLPSIKLDRRGINKHQSDMFPDYSRCLKRTLTRTQTSEDSEFAKKKPKLDQMVPIDQNSPEDQTLLQSDIKAQEVDEKMLSLDSEALDIDTKVSHLDSSMSFNIESPKIILKICAESSIQDYDDCELNMFHQITDTVKTLMNNVKKFQVVHKLKCENVHELTTTNEMQAMEIAHSQARIRELELQLETKQSKRVKGNDTQIAMIKLKENHANEITSLKKLHDKAIANMKKKIKSEQTDAEAKLKKTKSEHEDDMKKLKSKLCDDNKKVLGKLMDKHNDGLTEVQGKYEIEMGAEIICSLAEIESLKLQHYIESVQMEDKMKAIIEEKDNIESKLELKYMQIIGKMCDKAKEDHEAASMCKGCNEALPSNQFCGEQCEKMWKSREDRRTGE